MRVKATSTAFYAGSKVRPGDVLVVPDDFSAKWAEPIKVPTKKAKKKSKAGAKKASKKKAG